jgi:hypothetical protein
MVGKWSAVVNNLASMCNTRSDLGLYPALYESPAGSAIMLWLVQPVYPSNVVARAYWRIYSAAA